jgi:hypothetical protein
MQEPTNPGPPTDDLTEIELLLDRLHREVSGIHSILRFFKTVVLVLIALTVLYFLSVVLLFAAL